jgi:hypothetical protein
MLRKRKKIRTTNLSQREISTATAASPAVIILRKGLKEDVRE